ncbi:multidrug MFS transporter [Chitinimonas prasina]|uniref:Multidrug MFS transporter n=2 Tax=Chitinimonas prasina TaxID=1434937 RepID=A0ABQ5YIY1_9NEIS|nr:multidrug MFS transporter [Chitinimonas prasina]
MRPYRQRSRLRRTALLILLLLLAWPITLGVMIASYARVSDKRPADAAIVLGAATWGTQPSPVFRERLNHAIHLYQTGQVRLIVFTGGRGSRDEPPESIVGSQYALAQGVPLHAMVCEQHSTVTLENLQGVKPWVAQRKLNRVLLVSDPLHMRRAISMAQDLGLPASPSPTPSTRYTGLSSQAGFLLRETYYYSAYLLYRRFTQAGEPPAITVDSCRV